MNSHPDLKSNRAIKAAVEAFGPCDPKWAALVLFIGAARNLRAVMNDDEFASSIAYNMADQIATGEPV